MIKKLSLALPLFNLAFASPISVHVLNLETGLPGKNVTVILDKKTSSGWQKISQKSTDINGRIKDLFPVGTKFESGIYMVTFETGEYFNQQQQKSFFPEVNIVFQVESAGEHYHIPLLLNKYGYSTYRGN